MIRAQAGQLKAQWDKNRRAILVVSGKGTKIGERAKVIEHLHARHYDPTDYSWGPSFLEDLEKMGYDLATLKITVEKAQP